MKAEQINDEIKVENRQLAHLWHIKERTKNKEAIAKYVLDHVNLKTYLSVGFVNAAHPQRTFDRTGQTPQVEHRGSSQSYLVHTFLPKPDERAGV